MPFIKRSLTNIIFVKKKERKIYTTKHLQINQYFMHKIYTTKHLQIN